MKPFHFLLVFIVCGFLIPQALAQHWEWVNPQPCNSILSDIFFIDSQDGIICGNSGIILKTTDGGASWHQKYSGVSDNLHKIWMIDANNGIIIGYNTILKTFDGGETWVLKQSPNNISMYAVHFPTASIGYIVGSGGVVMKSLDGGETWNVIAAGTYSTLTGVWFLSPTLGFMTEGSSGYGSIYKSTDGGYTWNQIPQGFYSIQTLRFLDSSTGYATASYGTIYRTTNGGNYWDMVYQNSALNIYNVTFANLNTGYALCDQMSILKTTDGGTTWNTPAGFGPTDNYAGWFTSPDQGWILGIPDYNNPDEIAICTTTDGCHHFTNHVTGYTTGWSKIVAWQHGTVIAAGDSGIVLKSTDAGDSWFRISTGTFNPLRDITFSDATNLYAVGNTGTIVHSGNGGMNWGQQISGTNLNLNAVSFPSPGVGYAAGDYGTLLKTTDGGSTWTSLNPGVMTKLYGLKFIDNNIGYIVGGSGTILKTTNGGNTWVSIYMGGGSDFSCLYFLDALTGYVGGYYGLLKTADGGLTWNPLPYFNYGYITAIYFWDAMSGLVVDDQGGITLTADGGQTWTNMISSTSYSLGGICMDADNNFFAAGEYGVILRNYNLNVGKQEISPSTEAGMKVFPNPASDRVMVEATDKTALGNLSVYNSLGIKVMSSVFLGESATLNIGSLPGGIYIIRMENGNSGSTAKFMKK